jgi:UDP-N-acetylmuramoyl-L-alanyl-D-glutamate--2,6-diaminopimelate ligase
MLESIFRAAGLKPGVIGTTGYRLGDESRPAAFTTPEAPQLQALLREMVERSVRAVALEVSSHALAQRRSYGLECDVAIFLNLTQDHLDFHGTMEAYLDAKLMLFDGRNGGSKPAVAVVNADDPAGERVRAAAAAGGMRTLRFGIASGDAQPGAGLEVAVERIEPRTDGLGLRIADRFPDPVRAAGARAGPEAARSVLFDLSLPLLGRHNAANAAAAWAAAAVLGIDRQAARRGLETMPAVPGRLERVEAGQPFEVLVDYAHTPDALARSLAAVREHAAGRVLLVFGCGGDRDRAKRPLMGRAAAERADRAWVTNDNPRSEDPRAIAEQVVAGAAGAGLAIVLDRREAIAAALEAAQPGDAVLIAGKGHETTQTVGGRVLPFDDREVARALLAARRGAEA